MCVRTYIRTYEGRYACMYVCMCMYYMCITSIYHRHRAPRALTDVHWDERHVELLREAGSAILREAAAPRVGPPRSFRPELTSFLRKPLGSLKRALLKGI